MRLLPEFIHKSIRNAYRWYALRSRNYGLLYPPYYNLAVKYPNKYPDIYNESGSKLSLFFLRDKLFAHDPYWGDSKCFLWDRYNIGLDIHFYTHNSMLETMGNPVKRYGWLLESEGIRSNDYKIFEKNKGLEKDFDCIFTHSAKILDTVSNAVFMPGCSQPWYRKEYNVFGEEQYKYKTRDISIVSSWKASCDLHKLRSKIAMRCKSYNLADTFGTFDGGNYANVQDYLMNYRFSIIVENYISPYWFTEKVTNCFMSMTIPIYIGATEIGKFFNPDAIIQISPNDNIEKILKKCTKEYYEERLNAVLDNYNRIKNYNVMDNMYEKYIVDGIKVNNPKDFFL